AVGPGAEATIATGPGVLARDRRRPKHEVGDQRFFSVGETALLANGAEASLADRAGSREQHADRAITPLVRQRPEERVDSTRIERRTSPHEPRVVTLYLQHI